MDYLCEVYTNPARSATHNRQEHVFAPASYQYLRIISDYVTRKEIIQMRCLRPHLRGPRHRMASHDLFPADALPQMWQPPHHAKIPALFYGERSIQEDLGRNGEITKKQTIIIMSTELRKWDKVMSVALSVPGVKVNRNEFLVAALNNLCSVEQLKQICQFTLSGQCTCPR